MESYLSQRQALIASATPGVEAARELARLSDEAVRELAGRLGSRLGGRRTALVALGGWGRVRCCHRATWRHVWFSRTSPKPSLKAYVEAIFYPLWDASHRASGHPRGQLRAMKQDLRGLYRTPSPRPGRRRRLVLTRGQGTRTSDRAHSCARSLSTRDQAPPGAGARRKRRRKARLRRADVDRRGGVGRGCGHPGGLVTAGILSAEELAALEAAAEVVASGSASSWGVTAGVPR